MPLGVSYMGTKKALAEAVATQLEASRPGPLLDVFSGMCAVGSAVGSKRAVWSNDLQLFAASVSASFFCSNELPPTSGEASAKLFRAFNTNRSTLRSVYSDLLELEASALSGQSLEAHTKLAALIEMQSDAVGVPIPDRLITHHFPYDLFTSTYANSYLGVAQCADVDSIRFALDHTRRCGILSDEQHQWLLLALGRAMARCTTSTGHFAQPLRPKESNIRKYTSQRRRSIWKEWSDAVSILVPVGTRNWRQRNRSYRGDALSLLRSPPCDFEPSIIYADPPYTRDQYSRYYHLYETLILYDYPDAKGTGKYRSERAVSSFSSKRDVQKSMESLIAGSAAVGADLVLSYPAKAILDQSEVVIPDLLGTYYKRVAKPIRLQHVHSTMGGSKGEAKNVVTEIIYRAEA